MPINKDKYSDWESKIISKFYSSPHKINRNRTLKNTHGKSTKRSLTNDMLNLLPSDNNPIQLYKKKVIIAIDFISNDNIELSKLIEKGKITNNKNTTTESTAILPEKHSIKLFHIGNNKNDDVSFGWKKLDNGDIEFLHPAFDIGGLTNYKQLENTKTAWLPKKLIVDRDLSRVQMTELLSNLHKQWLAYSNKKTFYKYSNAKIQKIIQSIINYLDANQNYKYAKLCFIKLPTEYRVVTTSNDIFSETGNYYLRTYGKGDDHFAEQTKPNKKLYCGVTEKYITPNLNKGNILNEYSIKK